MTYVLMAIPAEMVLAVTEFIERQEVSPDRSSAAGAEELLHGWNEHAVRRAYRESGDGMRKVLSFLAQNAGHEVNADEIATAVGARFGWNSIAGMLGAFGRRSANRYHKPKPMWEYRYDSHGRALLLMPENVARAIQKAQEGD